jgi:hypothetical protein
MYVNGSLLSILTASLLSYDFIGDPSVFAAPGSPSPPAKNKSDGINDVSFSSSSSLFGNTVRSSKANKKAGDNGNDSGGGKCLYQSDFDHGTHIISESGVYKLCEDISFAPNKPNLDTASDEEIANAFDPCIQDEYNVNEFSLGFFAALVVSAPDVTLNLNGYTIQQDASHALLQRFFAVIELASAPFIAGAGPAQFVSDKLVPATNFKLQGPGVVGRSSHHGIHGNDNVNVMISNVVFRDFEVAAVSLNNVEGVSDMIA